jgi:hypothetical protein
MKTVSFSVSVKFPVKKVTDCFADAKFAKNHKASKLFAAAGIIKADKKMIIRTLALAGAEKAVVPVIAVINFSEAEAGKATAISATFVNVPDAKADEIKGLGKIIAEEIKTFLTPAPVKAVVKAPVKKAAAKKPAAKKPAAKAAVKAPAAKAPAAKKAVKAPAKKAAAKKPAAKPAVKAAVPAAPEAPKNQ